MKIFQSLDKQNKSFLILSGFILIAVLGIVNYLAGYEFAFSVFYVLPLLMITWAANRRLGLIASIVSTAVWFTADVTSGHSYSTPFISVWNALIRFAFFVIFTFLLSSLKSSQELAHTDYLTSAINSRYFYEIIQIEINRFQRYQHPFTIAYVDIDNFKIINDNFGHAKGNLVLQTVVSSMRKKIRKTDIVARLGGDEFALFFPETGEESVRILFTKLHNDLLDEMQKNYWPITFSVGVVTCTVAPTTIDELMSKADDLMYSAKSDGRNAVKYFTYTG